MKHGDAVVFTNDFLAALAMREGGEIRISRAELEAAPRNISVVISHGGRDADYVITAIQPTKPIEGM